MRHQGDIASLRDGRSGREDACAIQTRGLRIGHGGTVVATVPDLALSAGQARLLPGPSGSGKSTLLMTLAGLIAPVSGDVVLNGIGLGGLTPAGRDRLRGRRIGLVFQDIHGVPGLSVLSNVLLGAFATGSRQDRGRAMHLLDRVGLASLAARRFETLSRGEAQRVAIARALLLSPAVILADEPTASLDDANADAVADLLLRMAGETGAALIIATHDQRLRGRIDAVITIEAAS
ncbi:MAG: ATP-binding cassette domain-containing protein [Caulobacteraceae bacterium]|nr:ATP-binding cassette domain-containing protein [Caulobacteraceae bacterium]